MSVTLRTVKWSHLSTCLGLPVQSLDFGLSFGKTVKLWEICDATFSDHMPVTLHINIPFCLLVPLVQPDALVKSPQTLLTTSLLLIETPLSLHQDLLSLISFKCCSYLEHVCFSSAWAHLSLRLNECSC